MGTAAAAPEPSDEGTTLYADPTDLDALGTDSAESPSGVRDEPAAPLDTPLKRILRARWHEAADAPKIDARTWPAAGIPDGLLENVAPEHVPAHRLRQLRFADGRIVYEVWTPVPRGVQSAEDLRRASMGLLPVGSWRLSYHVYSPQWCDCPSARLEMGPRGLRHPECGRDRKSKVDGNFGDHVANLNLAPTDEMYNGFYPTIPGHDVVHYNPGKKGMEAHQGGHTFRNDSVEGGVLRGGTEIRGGRAEHRRKTKGMIELGPGYTKDVERNAAEQKAKKKAAERLKLEKTLQLAPRKPFDV